jgi:hypothetical protein
MFQIVGGIQVDVRGVGIHLLAIGAGRGAIRCQAIVFIVLQQNLLVGTADEIARGRNCYPVIRIPTA